jgi:hypothetical protein
MALGAVLLEVFLANMSPPEESQLNFTNPNQASGSPSSETEHATTPMSLI